METDPARTAEADLVALSETLTAPRPAECLLCYVDRMLTQFGCDTTLRWVRRWRQLRLPRATGLERRLGSRGAFCDCEVFLNGWTVRDDLWVPVPGGGDPSEDDVEDDWAAQVELDWPAERPACAGVGARSSQPCATWVPRRRGW